MPGSLRDEQQAVEAMIYERFRGVTRDGGVSWSESFVIDHYGTDEERAVARAKDRERGWEELVDDPTWHLAEWSSAFSFLDPIGFRYYLAPAMIRSVRSGSGVLEYKLTLSQREGSKEIEGLCMYHLEQISLLDRSQCEAVTAMIRFMIHFQRWRRYRWSVEAWIEAYRSYWRQFG